MIQKNADTQVEINKLISSRWSGKAFNPEREISRPDLLALFEAARWAPSCFGDEPWRFIIFNKSSHEKDWNNAFSCLAEGNQIWAKNAPVLALSIADTLLSRNGKTNRWGQYDTGAACMSMTLQATELGLMVHQMGGFDSNKARELFLIPEQFIPMAMMAIGYQVSKSDIPDEMVERELAERIRRPITESFYSGRWGNKIDL